MLMYIINALRVAIYDNNKKDAINNLKQLNKCGMDDATVYRLLSYDDAKKLYALINHK